MGQKPSKTSKPKSFLPTDLTCDRQYYENLINTKRIAPYEEGEEEEEEKEQEECFICYGVSRKKKKKTNKNNRCLKKDSIDVDNVNMGYVHIVI